MALVRELAAEWRSLGNKAFVYFLVATPRPVPSEVPLAELVARLYRRPGRATAFRLERLCHDFVAARWQERDSPPEGLLADPALPEASQVLLHAGLGMILTRRLFRSLHAKSTEGELAAALEGLLALTRANARPDLEPVVLEAAGMILRFLWSGLWARTVSSIRSRWPEAEPLFWHGAGRCFYFLPASSWPRPGALRHALSLCRGEPPDASGRCNAVAGVALASAMVNWSQPPLVERCFRMLDSEEEVDAFASGVLAALLTRRFTISETAVPPLLAHQSSATGLASASWQSEVQTPCSQILEHYDSLVARRQLGRFAAFVPLAAFRAELAAARFAG